MTLSKIITEDDYRGVEQLAFEVLHDGSAHIVQGADVVSIDKREADKLAAYLEIYANGGFDK